MTQPPLMTVLDGEFTWPEWTEYPVDRFGRSTRWAPCCHCGRRTRGQRTEKDGGQVVVTCMCPGCWLRYEDYALELAPGGAA